MRRRDLLAGLAAAPLPALARSPAASPERFGALAAAEFLSRPDFMTYKVDAVEAVHYAEVATAYGALRLAARTHDAALLEGVQARHARLVERALPNTANHVDANVYGVWPLAIADTQRRLGGSADARDRARGLAMADGQWAQAGPDGLTAQARYWIDDIWMIGALQLAAWRVTADARYLDRAALTARLYLAKLQQPNGLFHHGPDAPFFWARGNGWVAAGLAEILSELPASHPDRAPILAGYRRMMAALLRHQAADGMWRQLIDRDDAWPESSGTAMFGFAMALGAHRGWLTGPAYAAAAARAWRGLAAHVGSDGRLDGVCVGTGQSRDAAYYLARPTVAGDLHGQAALLWFASEMVAG